MKSFQWAIVHARFEALAVVAQWRCNPPAVHQVPVASIEQIEQWQELVPHIDPWAMIREFNRVVQYYHRKMFPAVRL